MLIQIAIQNPAVNRVSFNETPSTSCFASSTEISMTFQIHTFFYVFPMVKYSLIFNFKRKVLTKITILLNIFIVMVFQNYDFLSLVETKKKIFCECLFYFILNPTDFHCTDKTVKTLFKISSCVTQTTETKLTDFSFLGDLSLLNCYHRFSPTTPLDCYWSAKQIAPPINTRYWLSHCCCVKLGGFSYKQNNVLKTIRKNFKFSLHKLR